VVFGMPTVSSRVEQGQVRGVTFDEQDFARCAASSLAMPAAIAARTAAAHLVLPPPDDLVRIMAFDQTDPNADCASSSQLLLQGVATTI
jgi:hypothetical protein